MWYNPCIPNCPLELSRRLLNNMIIKRERQPHARPSIGEHQDLGTAWESFLIQKTTVAGEWRNEIKLKSIPDKPLPFGLLSWITSTQFLLTTLTIGQAWLTNQVTIHTRGNSVAEAKPRNLFWFSHCQKKPGCSKPALLSAALNAARVKHRPREKEGCDSAWQILAEYTAGV